MIFADSIKKQEIFMLAKKVWRILSLSLCAIRETKEIPIKK